jgi:WD40 repeat protein
MFNKLVSLKLLEGHRKAVKTVAFSPDGKFLVSSGEDKTILVWDLKTNQKFSLRKGFDQPWARVNQEINSLFNNELESIFKPAKPFQDLENKFKEFGEIIQTSSDDKINSVDFSPSQKLVASGGDDKMVKLWSLNDRKELDSMSGHTEKVYSVAFHPNGEILASASKDKTVKLWSVQTGEILSTLQGHKDKVLCVTFSRDGKLLASAGGENDKTVILWNLGDRNSITLKGHSDWFGGIRFVEISANGKFVATASMDKTIKIWQVKDGKEVISLEEHTDHVNSISISPNNQFLCSGSSDKTLKVWDLTKRVMMNSIPHPDTIYSVSFSPNGNYIATGCKDSMIRIYSTAELLT